MKYTDIKNNEMKHGHTHSLRAKQKIQACIIFKEKQNT
jgi:hypothetical protein